MAKSRTSKPTPRQTETEAKIKVDDFAALRPALAKAKAVFLGKVIQTDRYFDTPARDLLGGDIGVRLRQTLVLKKGKTRCDDRPLLTFKGPADAKAKFKTREETQARVDEPEVVDRVLTAAGLMPTLTIQKCRESYQLGPCIVELDELPLIGTFVEIEGPSAAAIERTRKLLKIKGKSTHDHYIKLALKACPSAGRECTELTFEACTPSCAASASSEGISPASEHMETIHRVPTLPSRDKAGHKGSYGHVLVVAGSLGMAGACALCANAALRGGAGLVTYATPANVQPTVVSMTPCATSIPLDVDAHGVLTPVSVRQVLQYKCTVLAMGPGMGQGQPQQRLVQAAIEQEKPLVLDAAGLTNLSHVDNWPARRRCPMIITPHPGEFSALTGRTTKDIQADRPGTAQAAIQAWLEASQCDAPLVLVLKGAGTIVTDGRRLYVNDSGNPGMATGGTGDVLTGLTAALLAQGMPPLEAAVLAVHAHGKAGDLAASEHGQVSLIATDLLDYLGKALKTK